MESMEHEAQCDWVDDDSLDADETLRRFRRLEAMQVVTDPPDLHFTTASITTGGDTITVTKSFFGRQQQAVKFS
jgi:hypothetical protein